MLKTDHYWCFRAFSKKQKLKGKFLDNLGQNICRHFQVLAQFPLTTCEAELDYYLENVNVPDAS